MRVQLTLLDSGFDVRSTAIWFSSHGMAVDVELIEEDVATARQMVQATREVVNSPLAPTPLEDDVRCSACSHVSVCLPDERAVEAVAAADERPAFAAQLADDADGVVRLCRASLGVSQRIPHGIDGSISVNRESSG